MALTYTYDTGHISHFALKKVEGSCHRDEDHTALIGVYCKIYCPFYAGMKDNFIICEYHKKDDPDPEVNEARYKICESLERDALRALDY